MHIPVRMGRSLVSLALALSFGTAGPLGAQNPEWLTSEGAQFFFWWERPQQTVDPNRSPGYPGDAWLEGTLIFGAHVPLTRRVQIVADLPLALVRGHTNGCLDAYCETPISAAVMGNPLLGMRFSAVPSRLWLQVQYRFSLMDLDPWEPEINTWQRSVDIMAAAAALAASDVSRRDAVMPHTSSIALDVMGSSDIPGDLRVQARAGVIRIEQDSSRAYHISYVHNTSTEFRYELALARQVGNGVFGVGVLGRKEVDWSPDWDCSQLGGNCRGPAEVEVSGSYAIGRFSPSVQWRLPITGARKKDIKWVLAAGVGVSWR